MAELIKIAVVGNAEIFELLEQHGADLLRTDSAISTGTRRIACGRRPSHLSGDRHDARPGGAQPARDRPGPGDRIRSHVESDAGACATRRRSSTVTPSTSTWRCRPHSPSSAGICRSTDRDRVLGVMSALGLALDSEHLTPELLERGDGGDPRTRDGLLRAAVPAPDRAMPFPQRRDHRRTGRHVVAAQEDLPRVSPRRRRHRRVHLATCGSCMHDVVPLRTSTGTTTGVRRHRDLRDANVVRTLGHSRRSVGDASRRPCRRGGALLRRRRPPAAGATAGARRTILLTGGKMTKALQLARSFHLRRTPGDPR